MNNTSILVLLVGIECFFNILGLITIVDDGWSQPPLAVNHPRCYGKKALNCSTLLTVKSLWKKTVKLSKQYTIYFALRPKLVQSKNNKTLKYKTKIQRLTDQLGIFLTNLSQSGFFVFHRAPHLVPTTPLQTPFTFIA